MSADAASPRFKALAPQFLVDDLAGAIGFYRDVLGFSFGETWGGFYAVGSRDGFQLHLKEAPKNPGDREHRRAHEHLDAYVELVGVAELYERCVAKGATIVQPLATTPWGSTEFQIADPEGYIIAFGEFRAAG